MPFGFTMAPAPATVSPPTIMRVSLTSNQSSDQREFDLAANAEPIIIGRASKTRGKQLEAQSSNALFDCPVVSRIHAELRTTFTGPYTQQVTITDLSSLHGTKVNGVPLMSGTRFTLKTGDVIKLGERVTRGDDAHEGVSLTFARLSVPSNTYNMSSPADIQPTNNTIRGFRAPSFSDASDMDSEHAGSYISDVEHHPSSAKTTPEQNKMSLGSQKAPTPLDDEDVTFSYRVPESDDRPALNSTQKTDFDGFSDAGSVQEPRFGDSLFLAESGIIGYEESEEDSDIDHVDDVEYGDEIDEDNMFNSASEMSGNEASDAQSDDEVEQEEDEQEDEDELAYREASPELGNFEVVTVASTTFADSMSQSLCDHPTSKQYDSIRGSAGVFEQDPEPYQQRGRTTITPFTYGYVPGYEAQLETNFGCRSFWDVGAPAFSTAVSQQGFAPTYDNAQGAPPVSFPMSINSIVEPPTKSNVDATAELTHEDVVVGSSVLSKEVIPEVVVDSNSKRKRDEVDETAEAVQPPAKKAAQAPVPSAVRRTLPLKKHRSTVGKAVIGATKAAAFATAGAIGTVAFLSSPMAESLIQWLG